MSSDLSVIKVKNYRSLADLHLGVNGVNILFGPNGVGKSTLLDTIWFIRDCAIRGVELASSARSHGIGILWDGATEGDQILISLSTPDVEYELRFGLSSGRIEPFAGEKLRELTGSGRVLIDRPVGSDKAQLFHGKVDQTLTVTLREPVKTSLGLFLDFNPSDRAAGDINRLLWSVRHYHSRSFFLHRLKTHGSETSYKTQLWDRGENAWSVLRNLHDRRSIDDRYDTIVKWMRKAFPTFDGLLLEQTGPETVYASFQEKGRRSSIQASGVSDGHLQLLLLLTAVFSEGRLPAVLLFDEPEVSLHPWALAVFAMAVLEAAKSWSKQIIIATHSPVLLSQFETDQILAANVADGQTHFRRLSDMVEIQDLLDNYAAGSLYMSQMVGAQAEEASLESAP